VNGVLKRQRLQAMADNKFVQDNLIGLKKTSHEWFVTINFYLAKQHRFANSNCFAGNRQNFGPKFVFEKVGFQSNNLVFVLIKKEKGDN